MNLTPNVTVEEFTATQHRNINNDLPAVMLATARATCEMVERIRAVLSHLAGRDVPVLISSGYRCLELNRAVGSADSSDHVRAMAVDFKAPAFGTPFQIASVLAPRVGELGVGQLIHEFGSWVHVSTRLPDKQINRIITISKAGTDVGVLEV